MATKTNEGWLVLLTDLGGDLNIEACADFFVACLADVAPRRWCIHKAGRGDAHSGFGAPTRAQLAVPELVHGLMVSGDAGFFSLLSCTRTRRVNKNWARVYPDRITGHEFQLNLKGLTDDAVDDARRRALDLVPALRALGATGGTLTWRARGANHETALPALSTPSSTPVT